ncbi:MAG: phosphatase PAP2-related protein [Elusimicrobiota bacterium]
MAFCGLLLAFYVNYLAGSLADVQGELARPSPDLLLRTLPFVDLRIVFVWGFVAFLVWACLAGWIFERHRIAHILWLYALLILVRAFFLILTPMHLPDGALLPREDSVHLFIGGFVNFKHDMFFSGHTAMPYLGYLAHRRTWVSWSFLGLSVVMAVTVLLARLHYSIDVFAAYFITYALYRFERRWLRRPYRRLRHAVFLRLSGPTPA